MSRYQKVLIIDDAEIDMYIAKHIMSRYKFAVEVIGMNSARKALEYISGFINMPELLPDLILLDINMPEMNGFEFLEAYKNLPDRLHAKCIIVMLTMSLRANDREKAASNPYVKNFLNKPLVPDLLYQL